MVIDGFNTPSNRRFTLCLSEDTVWESDIKQHFTEVPRNIRQIWVYGFLEIFNNAIEHSKGKKLKTGRQKYSTLVYMRLANSSDLVSRSQARRILSGLELFKDVTLDFRDIEYIGQAFADEIFRVFTAMNPCVTVKAQNANAEVTYMINRAMNTKI